jgi:hypothetical protein
MRYLRRATVYAIPDASIERLTREIVRGNIDAGYQRAIFIHCGTNNLYRDTPTIICEKMATLYDTIRYRNWNCKIVISGMIMRPRDEENDVVFTEKGEPLLADKRCDANDLLTEMVRMKGGELLKSWKCIMVKDRANTAMYYRDGLHLSVAGIDRFSQYIINNIGRALSKKN